MNNNKNAYYLLGLLIFVMSGSATATVFDFTTSTLGVPGGSAYNTVGMSTDGISVDITAYTITNDGNGNITASSQITGPGLGVYVSSHDNLGVLSNARRDSKSLDGGSSRSRTDLDEGLLFSFNQMVSLDFVDFDKFGRFDDFNLTVDGSLILADFDGHPISPNSAHIVGNSSKFDFFNVIGQEFLIWADSGSDSFRIDSLRVSAVPEPASLFLLGAGLAGLCFSRRNVRSH